MQQGIFNIKQAIMGTVLLVVLTSLPVDTYAVRDGEKGKRSLSITKEKEKEQVEDQETVASSSQSPSEYITLVEALKRYAQTNNIQNIESCLLLNNPEWLNGVIGTLVQTGRGTLSKLPVEVWDYILSYISDKKDFSSASLTCSVFNNLLKSGWMSYGLAKGMTPSKLKELVAPSKDSTPLPTLTQCKDKVKDIKIMGADCHGDSVEFTDEDLKPLSQFPNLEKLCLSFCDQITGEGFQYLPISLRELCIHDCSNITDTALKHLSKLENLSELYLSRCDQITGEGFQYLPISLRELYIHDCSNITDDGIEHMAKLENLSKLCMAHCKRITDIGISSLLRKCPNIMSLIIRDCNELEDGEVKSLAEYCPNITNLYLEGCWNLTSQALEHLKNMPLVELDLRMTPVNNEGLKNLQDMPLKVLRLHGAFTDVLNNSTNITDDTIQYLPKSLTQLYLRSTSISDKGFKEIMERCPDLTYLDLGVCPQVTGASLKFLPECCPNLTTLLLGGGVNNITTDGLAAIVEKFPNLTYLNLNLCSNIKDFSYISKLSKLEDLDVSQTSVCSDELISIVQNCQNLTKLSIYGWNDIGMDTLRVCKLIKPNLNIQH